MHLLRCAYRRDECKGERKGARDGAEDEECFDWADKKIATGKIEESERERESGGRKGRRRMES